MVFSTETIKAAANRQKAYYNKINECIECNNVDEFAPKVITEENYRNTLEKDIVDARESIICLFVNSADNIDNRFHTKADYLALRNPEIVKSISDSIYNIEHPSICETYA